MTADPTARRKAMAYELQAIAAAMRKQHDIEFSKMPWDSNVYWLELARAAKEAQLNYGNAPLEAELTALREITVDARNAMVDALGVGASSMTTAQAIRALNRERIRLEDIVNQQGSDRVGKWEQREAQLATLEAENETLREQLGKATEMNHRQAKDIGGLEGYLGKDGTAFLHTGTPATVEAVRRIEELKAQLAQAQKPAGKSLADMIAESTTLAMGQRTAALETMIREFLKQTGAKVEDCVLVEQMEDTKLTWHIEHRPKGEGGET